MTAAQRLRKLFFWDITGGQDEATNVTAVAPTADAQSEALEDETGQEEVIEPVADEGQDEGDEAVDVQSEGVAAETGQFDYQFVFGSAEPVEDPTDEPIEDTTPTTNKLIDDTPEIAEIPETQPYQDKHDYVDSSPAHYEWVTWCPPSKSKNSHSDWRSKASKSKFSKDNYGWEEAPDWDGPQLWSSKSSKSNKRLFGWGRVWDGAPRGHKGPRPGHRDLASEWQSEWQQPWDWWGSKASKSSNGCIKKKRKITPKPTPAPSVSAQPTPPTPPPTTPPVSLLSVA